MPRYIDANKARSIENLDNYGTFALGLGTISDVQEVLDDAPTADVAPVVHARWINKTPYQSIVCSNCGNLRLGHIDANSKFTPAFCENCGAKMDGKEPKEDNLKICKHSNRCGYCSIHEGYCCESPCADEELIEYVLLVHGEWKEYDGTDRGYHYCTNCEQQAFNYGENGNVIEVLSDYCPKCGARMDR